jgi:hypothetical protein
MFCSMKKICSLGISIATIVLGSIASAQQITVVPLSSTAVSSNYAISPQADGVTFVGDAENENDFLIVVDGDVSKASILTMSPEGARWCCRWGRCCRRRNCGRRDSSLHSCT